MPTTPPTTTRRSVTARHLALLLLNVALLTVFLTLFFTRPAESAPTDGQASPTWTAQPVLTVAPQTPEILPTATTSSGSGSGGHTIPTATPQPTAPPAATATPIPTVPVGGG